MVSDSILVLGGHLSLLRERAERLQSAVPADGTFLARTRRCAYRWRRSGRRSGLMPVGEEFLEQAREIYEDMKVRTSFTEYSLEEQDLLGAEEEESSFEVVRKVLRTKEVKRTIGNVKKENEEIRKLKEENKKEKEKRGGAVIRALSHGADVIEQEGCENLSLE
ncbi:hypothetical protein KSP39_PZI022327 [Platanthera zijinensis]|uniref:Uncharacterized protein n=1 Tax=Platanthera zijinensis TaxID=2320716 RepID=A0AAP0AVJ2_9ASPA